MPALNNRANLPDAVVRACENDPYNMGDADYSCTGIIDAPRITTLKKRHGHEVVEDVLDRIWRMFGNLGHKLLERAGADNAFMEERLFADIGGRKISVEIGAVPIAQADRRRRVISPHMIRVRRLGNRHHRRLSQGPGQGDGCPDCALAGSVAGMHLGHDGDGIAAVSIRSMPILSRPRNGKATPPRVVTRRTTPPVFSISVTVSPYFLDFARRINQRIATTGKTTIAPTSMNGPSQH